MQNRFLPASAPALDHAEGARHIGFVRQSPLREGQLANRRLVIARRIIMIKSEREMSFTQIRAGGARPSPPPLSLSRFAPALVVAKPEELAVNPRSEIMREGKLRDRAPAPVRARAALFRRSHADRRSRSSERDRALEYKDHRPEVPRRRHLQAGHFARREIGPQCPNDTFGQLGLDGEEIGQLAIECLRPDVGVGPRIDELGIHPDAIAGASHRAFEDMRDAERFADLAQVARAGAILLHRSAADHFQVGDPRQTGENVVVHAFSKESVLAIVAQVFKRKNGDTFFRHRPARERRSSVRLIPEGVMS